MRIIYCSQNNYELNAQSHAGIRLIVNIQYLTCPTRDAASTQLRT